MREIERTRSDLDDLVHRGTVEKIYTELGHSRALLITVQSEAKRASRLLADIKWWLQFCAGILVLIAVLIWQRS